MSHLATVDVQVKDLDALKAACKSLGLEFVSGQTAFKWYGRYLGGYPLPEGFAPEDMGRCEHALRLKDNPDAYEVGVVKRRNGKPGFLLMYDFWQGGFGLEEVIGQQAGRLRQQYAVQVAMKAARKQGFRVRHTVATDGTVRLVCAR